MDYNNNHNNSPIDDSSAFKNEDQEEVIIKAIGVGGGGGNAVEHMITHGAKGIEFIAAIYIIIGIGTGGSLPSLVRANHLRRTIRIGNT